MTIKEVNDILDAGGEKVDNELVDLIFNGYYDKAIAYIINLTGCEEEIAREIAYEIYPLEDYEADMARAAAREAEGAKVCIPKCPTCGSTDLKRIGFIETYLDISAGTNVPTFRCGNCGYRW